MNEIFELKPYIIPSQNTAFRCTPSGGSMLSKLSTPLPMRTVFVVVSRYKALSDRSIHRRPSCSIEPALIHSRAVLRCIPIEGKMDKVKKGYETRIQQDLLTDAILGKNRIKLYQQHFQVSIVLRYCDRSTSHPSIFHSL